jgi:hypothetical protein
MTLDERLKALVMRNVLLARDVEALCARVEAEKTAFPIPAGAIQVDASRIRLHAAREFEANNIRDLRATVEVETNNIRDLRATVEVDANNIRALARIAEIHERRLTGLEGATS